MGSNKCGLNGLSGPMNTRTYDCIGSEGHGRKWKEKNTKLPLNWVQPLKECIGFLSLNFPNKTHLFRFLTLRTSGPRPCSTAPFCPQPHCLQAPSHPLSFHSYSLLLCSLLYPHFPFFLCFLFLSVSFLFKLGFCFFNSFVDNLFDLCFFSRFSKFALTFVWVLVFTLCLVENNGYLIS